MNGDGDGGSRKLLGDLANDRKQDCLAREQKTKVHQIYICLTHPSIYQQLDKPSCATYLL